jgi:hypothetical protein
MSELFSHGQHETLPDGLFRTRIWGRPVNYLSGGVYLPINNDWQNGDEGNPHIVSAAPLRVRADGVGRRNLYPIPGNDAVYIQIGRPWAIIGGTWQAAPMNPLERQGGRLQSINGNYNLYLDQCGHYAKLGILLKNGFVPTNNRFGFPVSLVGLTRQGSNVLYNGQVVMKVQPPVVYDWQNPDDVRPITFQFTTFGGQTGVVFILPDLTGMALPLVDPTLTLQPGAADGVDTYIEQNSANANFGVATTIRAGLGAAGTVRRGLLKIDISSLPAAVTLTAASLTVHCANELSSTDYSVGAHRAITAFFEGIRNGATPSEDGSTWNFRNHNGSVAWAGGAGGAAGSDWTATATDTKSITGVGDFVFNVLADVQAWYGGATNLGWWLVNASEGTANSRKDFDSSDGATSGDRPELAITYGLGGGGVFYPGVLASAVFGGALVR